LTTALEGVRGRHKTPGRYLHPGKTRYPVVRHRGSVEAVRGVQLLLYSFLTTALEGVIVSITPGVYLLAGKTRYLLVQTLRLFTGRKVCNVLLYSFLTTALEVVRERHKSLGRYLHPGKTRYPLYRHWGSLKDARGSRCVPLLILHYSTRRCELSA